MAVRLPCQQTKWWTSTSQTAVNAAAVVTRALVGVWRCCFLPSKRDTQRFLSHLFFLCSEKLHRWSFNKEGKKKQQDATIFILAVFAALQQLAAVNHKARGIVFFYAFCFVFLHIPENIIYLFFAVNLPWSNRSSASLSSSCFAKKKKLNWRRKRVSSTRCSASGRRCDMNQPPTCETLPSAGGSPGKTLRRQPCLPTNCRLSPRTGTVQLHQGEFNVVADLPAGVKRLDVTSWWRVQRRVDLRRAGGRSSLPRRCCRGPERVTTIRICVLCTRALVCAWLENWDCEGAAERRTQKMDYIITQGPFDSESAHMYFNSSFPCRNVHIFLISV